MSSLYSQNHVDSVTSLHHYQMSYVYSEFILSLINARLAWTCKNSVGVGPHWVSVILQAELQAELQALYQMPRSSAVEEQKAAIRQELQSSR